MAGTPVTINGTTYYVPTASQDPNWGNDLHDTVVALSDVLATISGSADIPMTSFTLANNTSSPTNITSASFSIGSVRGFVLRYSIYISTSTTEYSETGTLHGTYKSTAGTFELSQTFTGSSNITFSITSNGQLQYTSGNTSGTSYTGKLKFYANAFLQA